MEVSENVYPCPAAYSLVDAERGQWCQVPVPDIERNLIKELGAAYWQKVLTNSFQASGPAPQGRKWPSVTHEMYLKYFHLLKPNVQDPSLVRS